MVIDTGQALMSLDGASFEVVARRQGDDAPARYAYQFATAPSGATGDAMTAAPGERVAWLTEALRAGSIRSHLVVEDESHLHAGHAGAAGGGGHFRALIVSAAFRGQTRVARQRAVYALLGDAMRIDHPRAGAAHADAGGVGSGVGRAHARSPRP